MKEEKVKVRQKAFNLENTFERGLMMSFIKQNTFDVFFVFT